MTYQEALIFIAIVLAIVPLWRAVICLGATLHMIAFTRLTKSDFDAKNFFINSFTHCFPSKGAVFIKDGRTQFIRGYVTLGYRMSMEHRLSISVKSRAKRGSRLKVTPNRSWFGQPKNYFGDSWDKKLIVQGTPRDFGLKLLESEHLRSQVYKALLGDRLLPELESSLIISRTGTVTLNIHGTFWNPWRTISLLALVDSIAIKAN